METNYSICRCTIKYENNDKNNKEKIMEELKDSEIFKQIYDLSIKSNIKYLKCMPSKLFKNFKIYLIITNLILFIFNILEFVTMFKNPKKGEEKKDEKEEEKKEDEKEEDKIEDEKKEKKAKKCKYLIKIKLLILGKLAVLQIEIIIVLLLIF